MIIQKSLRGLYNNAQFIFECFMTYKTPSGLKKHLKSTELESHQMTKMFSFRLLLFFLRQASSNVHEIPN